MDWSENSENAKLLLKLRAENKSFTQCGKIMGCSRSSISSAVRRISEHPITKTKNGNDWDTKLFEPWADYTARKKAERLAAKRKTD